MSKPNDTLIPLAKKGWFHKSGKFIPIPTIRGDYHHINLAVDKPHLFGLTHKKIGDVVYAGRDATATMHWSDAGNALLNKKGYMRYMHPSKSHLNMHTVGFENRIGAPEDFIEPLKRIRHNIENHGVIFEPIRTYGHITIDNYAGDSPLTEFLKKRGIHHYGESQFDIRDMHTLNRYIGDREGGEREKRDRDQIPTTREVTSTEVRNAMGERPAHIPLAQWNNMRNIGDSYEPRLLTFNDPIIKYKSLLEANTPQLDDKLEEKFFIHKDTGEFLPIPNNYNFFGIHHSGVFVENPKKFGVSDEDLEDHISRLSKAKKAKFDDLLNRRSNFNQDLMKFVGERGWTRGLYHKSRISPMIGSAFHHTIELEDHSRSTSRDHLRNIATTLHSKINNLISNPEDTISILVSGLKLTKKEVDDFTTKGIAAIPSTARFTRQQIHQLSIGGDIPRRSIRDIDSPTREVTSTEVRNAMGERPPHIPLAQWNNMRNIGDSYEPRLLTFKEFII